MNRTAIRSVLALAVAAPLSVAPALAEQHTTETGDMSSGTGAETSPGTGTGTSSDTGDSVSTAEGQDGANAGGDAQMQQDEAANQLIATVGESEIRGADVQQMLMAFPAQIRQSQPTEALVPMAVEQLVLRELILQDAMSQNMAEDEEVQQVISDNAQRSEEDAMVQVYLQREMDGAVTDDAVQETYDQITANTDQEVPPLDAVRPQIEQQLRQQRFTELGSELRQDVEVVYYGPDGEPMEAGTAPAGAGAMGGDSSSMESDDSSSMESGDSSMSDDAEMETDGEMSTDN